MKVTQIDLQREFHLARQNTIQLHPIPELPVSRPLSARSDLPGIRRALAGTRHLLLMYRRQLQDEKARRKLQRWTGVFPPSSLNLIDLPKPKNEERLAG